MYTSQIALGELKINQLRKKFKNEIISIAKKTVRIIKNRKTEGLGKEAKNLCKETKQ